MKAILEFELPEDQQEYEMANNANKMLTYSMKIEACNKVRVNNE
jgi:hypothetical protein